MNEDRPHTELLSLFQEHFPLLDELTAQIGNKRAGKFPSMFGFMLECMTATNHDPICFVVPNKKNVATVLSILIALSEIKNRFSEWVSNYAKQIEPGTRVCVLPHRDVFEYGGVWKDMPGLFQLRVLNSRGDSRSFPEREVLRLEKTDRARPKGQLERAFPDILSDCPIDQLLKINSFGNKSVFECTTLFFGNQQEYFDFVETLRVSRGTLTVNLANCLTIGTFSSSSQLTCGGVGTDVLFPMIGVTNRPLHLSRYARETAPFSRYFVVDGAERLVRNIQTFDQIASRQKLVVIASNEEYTSISELKTHGCVVWELAAEELGFGATKESCMPELTQNAKTGLSNGLAVEMQNMELTLAADILDRLQDRLVTHDESHELEERISDCWFLLLELSSICTPEQDYDALKHKLGVVKAEIVRNQAYLAKEPAQELLKCIELFDTNIEKQRSGTCEKMSWLRATLSSAKLSRCVILAKNQESAKWISSWLTKEFPDVGVATYGNVDELSDAATLIVPGWPGRRLWTRLCGTANFSILQFAGYAFELDWLNAYQDRLAAVLDSFTLSRNEKCSLMDLAWLADSALPEAREYPRFILNIARTRNRSIPRFETVDARVTDTGPRKDRIDLDAPVDGRDARYVSFVGEAYAYITDGCRLPLLNDLTDGGKGNVKIISGAELAIGDVVLFREVGESDVIQLIARSLLGETEYHKLRQTAGLWRAPLQRIRADKNTIEKWLGEVGLRRSVQTINLWLNDPDLIGPTGDEDIEKIARMTRDPVLMEKSADVAAAIRQVRKLHQQAGRMLTDLILQALPKEIDKEVKISLEFGEAYIVEVESIEDRLRTYPTLQVNKLRTQA